MILRTDESWVRDATFLCRLQREDQDRWLSLCVREHSGPRTPLLNGRSALLLLSGEVEVDTGMQLGTRRGLSGRLFGAGSLMHDREARVVSTTPVEYLRIGVDELEGANVGWAVRELMHHLADLEHQLEVLDEVMRQEPTLRALPPAWREQLLQCSTVKDLQPGDLLLENGRRNSDLILMLRGTARLTSGAAKGSPRSGQLIPAGTLLGLQDFDAEQPPVQPYRIEAPVGGRALVIPWRALAHLFQRLRATQPRVTALSRDARRGHAHLIHSVESNLGSTALCLGTAIAMGQMNHKAVVLDFDGARTASRLQLTGVKRNLEGVTANVASLGAGLPELWWPDREADGENLLVEMQLKHSHVLVSHVRTQVPARGFLDRLTTLIHLYGEENEVCDAPLAQHQRMIHALRIPEKGFPARRTSLRTHMDDDSRSHTREQTVRVPTDPAVGDVYRRRRSVRQLGMDEIPFGRACNRLARMLLGKATGLALGGGGAWGFAHLGLLRALHESNIPVDYVSGTSFGAVVGAMWVARGLEGLVALERSARFMPVVATGCVVSTVPLGLYIERLVGNVHQLSTEVPLLAVASDVRTASSFVLPWGTLADAVRSSSGFPGLFASFTYGGKRLVDGGVSANVPAEVVHTAGADFILASNVVPRVLDERTPINEVPGISRVMDLVRSTLALMHRSSARDAALADHVFNARVGDYTPAEFWAGPRIAEVAYEQAMSEMPAIRASYDADLSTHLIEE